MRRPLALAVATALAFVAVSCGHKSNPKQALLSASSKTVGGHTARMSFTTRIRAKTGAPTDITGAGVFDLTKHQGTLNVKLPPFGGQDLGTIEVRIFETTIYEKLPAKLASLAGSKGWGKIDLDALAKQNGFDLNSLAQAQSGDPLQALDLLKTVSDDVTEVGKEKVRGADTTHYRATVDLGKALAANQQLDAAAKSNLGSLYKNFTVPTDVWTDSEGRLRKMTYTIDPAKFDAAGLSSNPKVASGVQQIAGIDLSFELYQFGVPVSVTVPPSSEVTDLTGTLTAGA
jgi:hypothetical protein